MFAAIDFARSARLFSLGLVLPLLAACAYFADDGHWTKPGASAADTEADLAQCEALARDETATDRAINQDIAANRPLSAGSPIVPQAGGATSDRQRYRDILAACMAELGYSPAP